MKALSIKEPWATAIVRGNKRIENRTWRQDSIIGERIAIHASLTPDTKRQRTLCEQIARRDCPMEPHDRSAEAPGCIVGLATIEDIVDGDPEAEYVERFDEPTWWTGPYGYLLRDVCFFVEPIPCKGALRFWTVPDEVLEKIEAAETRTRSSFWAKENTAHVCAHLKRMDRIEEEFDQAFEDACRVIGDMEGW